MTEVPRAHTPKPNLRVRNAIMQSGAGYLFLGIYFEFAGFDLNGNNVVVAVIALAQSRQNVLRKNRLAHLSHLLFAVSASRGSHGLLPPKSEKFHSRIIPRRRRTTNNSACNAMDTEV
jgi:hypothetical protein